MMKVRLLNNGEFETLERLQFPIEVNGSKYGDGQLIKVPVNTLIDINNVDSEALKRDVSPHDFYLFEIGSECEVI
ncbi:TPA: hypothetical protein SMP74_000081 [Proteus mirabilis]|uniref:hypothetical protein n=2 Tax=Proteus mirabilis TaxID=584 RepID=UPI00192B2ABD|nr:hypothetical protein [Proteus mirabilis]QQZ22446.1 hypothetical protein F7R84_14250 [Proteus mirabilis]QQZ26172.1 hypothetical protein F7R85_14250 [Proteus mirabilis]HAT5559552.1 hypothetical protein [Proteus mirabilis]HEI7947534.1 hypothetical protein [Proteus mirabilis]HEI9857554.1 hypothetical protein [Proteus mirabilis]